MAALVNKGADVNARDDDGVTPLMDAARTGQLEAARTLVAAGADINAAAEDGDTAMTLATLNEKEEIIQYLLYVQSSSSMMLLL